MGSSSKTANATAAPRIGRSQMSFVCALFCPASYSPDLRTLIVTHTWKAKAARMARTTKTSDRDTGRSIGPWGVPGKPPDVFFLRVLAFPSRQGEIAGMRRGDFFGHWLLFALCTCGCDDPLVYPLKSPAVQEAGAKDAGLPRGVVDASVDAGNDAATP